MPRLTPAEIAHQERISADHWMAKARAARTAKDFETAAECDGIVKIATETAERAERMETENA